MPARKQARILKTGTINKNRNYSKSYVIIPEKVKSSGLINALVAAV